MNAALFLIATAWTAGADEAPGIAQVSDTAPAVVSAGASSCDGGCATACDSGCESRRCGLFSRLRGRSHHGCGGCETSCAPAPCPAPCPAPAPCPTPVCKPVCQPAPAECRKPAPAPVCAPAPASTCGGCATACDCGCGRHGLFSHHRRHGCDSGCDTGCSPCGNGAAVAPGAVAPAPIAPGSPYNPMPDPVAPPKQMPLPRKVGSVAPTTGVTPVVGPKATVEPAPINPF